MDPPSPQLVERLIGSGLCRPRDLRRCRARVRRLARDIPTFESVWLDALVQTRTLTAFQADVLGSDTPDRIVVGPFVLADRAGDDGRFTHFRARRRDSTTSYRLSQPRDERDSPVAVEDRLRRFLERTAAVVHPGLAVPLGFETVEGQLWVASPWIAGATLQQLLVRRGRFAPACVAAIALQLCDALFALESVDVLHGDVRLRNVAMTPRGQAVLIIPGLRIALFPEQTIHADVPPDDCDGVAPERIGVGQPATIAADVYSLGCLLWELLAGRPVFPHGDPLAKLAAHQSQQIPDVRDWAPETPAGLAELIRQLTQKSAPERPQSFRDVAARLEQLRRASRRELARFAQGSAATLPVAHSDHDATHRGAKAFAVGVLLLAASSVLLLNSGARTELLNINQRSPAKTEAIQETPGPAQPASPPTEHLQPLPAPNSDGVIELNGPGPYAAGRLDAAQRLVIRGSHERAKVVVGNQPLIVQAELLMLDNIVVQRLNTADAEVESPLVVVEAREFAMRRCRLDNGGRPGRAAVAWQLTDSTSATRGRALITQSMFVGGGPAVQVRGSPSQVSFDNVLHCGPHALLELSTQGADSQPVDVLARRVTLRGASPLINVRLLADARLPTLLTLTLEDSVAELSHAALVEFSGPDAPDDWQRRLQITGESSVVPPGAEIVALRMSPDRVRNLPTSGVSIEGLQAAEFGFAGPAGARPADSVIVGFNGYGRSARPPGIDPAGLPADMPGAYNSSADADERLTPRSDSSLSLKP